MVLAGDHTAWSRPDAVTLKDRTYEHQAQPMSGAKPVTVGQGYSTIAWIPDESGSWALPLLHERITSFDNPITKAAAQLKLVCQHLPQRPISLWDAEYGCASFVKQTADVAADKLMRLRSNRVLYGAPPPYTGFGRPRVHGEKFKLNDSTTWPTPNQMMQVNHPKLGLLCLRLWTHLHFQQSAKHLMSVIQVERTEIGERTNSKPFWLVWVGEQNKSLCSIWHQYLRRFAVDHWYRFIKQRLHWTLPHFSTPEQSERWSDLMPLLSWQLWLAKDGIKDCPLPWQKPCQNLSPGRVANAFATVLARIGTPASNPKPRGKSSGWSPGRPRKQRTRYPIVKKTFTKPKKVSKNTA
ncbi:NF041680 family putative transposase [Nostoc sp. 'Peltigera malacea cyanobiont' DB3992]|uniref:NF041680 family putative transposase n=1 Tax=Nostoc sp. 'Peltigera malacea cyanobiont' DB3992 TaxID=1206980 RepID=UPI00211E1ED3|nr:NF041680 family putative transposase [Nostoc sp. 'Peltigera malacea cyanobiont' DB3992]